MNIEEGKIYRTKEGETIGPMVWDSVVKVWRRGPECKTGDYWHEDGSRYGHCDDDMDLVAEVTG